LVGDTAIAAHVATRSDAFAPRPFRAWPTPAGRFSPPPGWGPTHRPRGRRYLRPGRADRCPLCQFRNNSSTAGGSGHGLAGLDPAGRQIGTRPSRDRSWQPVRTCAHEPPSSELGPRPNEIAAASALARDDVEDVPVLPLPGAGRVVAVEL